MYACASRSVVHLHLSLKAVKLKRHNWKSDHLEPCPWMDRSGLLQQAANAMGYAVIPVEVSRWSSVVGLVPWPSPISSDLPISVYNVGIHDNIKNIISNKAPATADCSKSNQAYKP